MDSAPTRRPSHLKGIHSNSPTPIFKTCDNRNIIKLYDIKKTANNFYLII